MDRQVRIQELDGSATIFLDVSSETLDVIYNILNLECDKVTASYKLDWQLARCSC